MMAKHYAPRAPLELADDDGRARVETLLASRQARRVAHVAGAADIAGAVRIMMPSEPTGYAVRLYAALHELDAAGVERIVVARLPEGDDWVAIRDRLVARQPVDEIDRLFRRRQIRCCQRRRQKRTHQAMPS